MGIRTTAVAAVIMLCNVVPRRSSRSGSFPDARDPSTSRRLTGPIVDRYRLEGGPAGPLGRPVADLRRAGSDPRTPVGADREARFEYGSIYLNRAASSTKVVFQDVDAVA